MTDELKLLVNNFLIQIYAKIMFRHLLHIVHTCKHNNIL